MTVKPPRASRTSPLLLAGMAALLLGTAATCARADEERKLLHGGLEREYLLHVPRKPASPAPLVLVLHGGHGDMKGMRKLTRSRFEKLAETEGFLVVYPNAHEGNWNDGRGLERYAAQRDKVDDVGFIASLIDAVDREVRVDRARVYVTGASNGAMMSERLAIELSDKLAAAAPVMGQIPAAIASSAHPARAVPLLIVNGTEDPLVPWEGGEVHFGARKLGAVLSTADTVRFWTKNNRCDAKPFVDWLPDVDKDDGTRVCRESYKGDAPVILYRVEGGGHTWPGGLQYLPQGMIGRTCRDFDACDAIWEFFKKQKLPERPAR